MPYPIFPTYLHLLAQYCYSCQFYLVVLICFVKQITSHYSKNVDRYKYQNWHVCSLLITFLIEPISHLKTAVIFVMADEKGGKYKFSLHKVSKTCIYE